MKIYFPGSKRITAEYRGFTIESDQSIESDGCGENPTPFDLFKASLGTCMAYYVMAFCMERDIPLDCIWLQFHFEEEKIIQSIKVRIVVDERFPAKYFNSVVRATEACKIKKQLLHPPSYEVLTVLNSEVSEKE
ncbi:MAG: OsmC family protein [Anaerolineales bacterium]|nr:OsmC family protein [Anaerolineales bacterium]